MKKISVIGSGQVGATAAYRLAQREMGDIVLVDIVEGIAQGKALDLMQSAPIVGYDVDIKGTTKYCDIEGSDMVIITAGVPRKPGMSRSDLLKVNASIIKDVVNNIVKYAPDIFYS